MDQSLWDAAQHGSIDALYALIQRDPNVLDRIDDIPFVETPLHTVASAGHTRFAMEIMRLKPSFARKLNQDGFTPLHLALQKLHPLENESNDNQVLLENESNDDQALQNNHTQLAYRLVSVDKDLVRVQGREGVTPLHYVAQIGNLDLLSKFLEDCPTSVQDVTIRGETVFHIALKYNNLHALKYLIKWIQSATNEYASSWEKKLLNWEDEEGNTVLHIAVSKNQPQVVRQLLNAGVHINRKNLWGFTALDICFQDGNNERSMKCMLCCAGALRASSLATVKSCEALLKSHCLIYSTYKKLLIWRLRQQKKITNDLRNMLLVIVVLFITATYQTALSPPGGVWQDNYNPPTDDQFNSTIFPIIPNNVTSDLSPTPHRVGTVTMKNNYFTLLTGTNAACFVLSAFIILPLLLPLETISFLCFSPMIFLFVSYVISNAVIYPFGPIDWIHF
ncbi:ankyrin repeat-containing protein BDA1-like [Alnus glutinosa]|uniref:ankyrin repeat-containing protein BDA1-like n=1 Tax=Alnus glutinosa TaxID=3517 RepID=UPI002D7797F2|nr:ankyrin repeat-containing protein BDA1-like [Alnus glutinosa]